MTKGDDLAASLDEFAAAKKSARPTAWWFTLPEEIRQVIIDSPHATHTIVDWLHTIGYPDATYSKVENYRHGKRS